VNRSQLLKRLDDAWKALQESSAGLSDSEMMEVGVTRAWSVKDIIAHVTWWEEEALKHLPIIVEGGRPPRYSVTYGGIDAFNAQKTMERKRLSLEDVLRQQEETHSRLLEYLESVPEEYFKGDTRFRRRLRLDTYGHYSRHTEAIRRWRRKILAGEKKKD
jgi:hypothetical protein